MTLRIPDPADSLRVFLHEPDIVELVLRFPKLSRTEIVDVVTAIGPMRQAVEVELTRLSSRKR
jgi:hypothetical protein